LSVRTVFAVLLIAGATLIGVELALGARDYGRVELAPACSASTTVDRGGVDGTVQQIALRALSVAACDLGTTREKLVLSLSPQSGRRFGSWSDQGLERALRGGLVRAIDEAQDRGELNSVEAGVLRELARRAPVELVVEVAKNADALSALGRLLP
jgi:hypothetical protein